MSGVSVKEDWGLSIRIGKGFDVVEANELTLSSGPPLAFLSPICRLALFPPGRVNAEPLASFLGSSVLLRWGLMESFLDLSDFGSGTRFGTGGVCFSGLSLGRCRITSQ